MSVKGDSPTRGRPKTLERDHVLKTAMMCYWANSPTEVSIREVCDKADVSKPGLYREFDSDDGLKEAVLEAYSEMVNKQVYDILDSDQSFDEVVESIIVHTTRDRRSQGIPDGCLFFAMRERECEFGSLTRDKIDQLRNASLKKYRQWIDEAKSNGQSTTTMSADIAALYIDAQIGSAMRLQREGVSNQVIAEILRTAFSVLR